LNKKMSALLILIAMMVIAAPSARAIDWVTSWTDKPQYGYGERGTIYVAFHNNYDVAIQIYNITLEYNGWTAYISNTWVGTETKQYVDLTIASNITRLFNDLTFTTPTDGRAGDTSVDITVRTDHGSFYDTAYINLFESNRYMDQIVTLFTVLVVLVVVCTVIIAAAVFLSARRPQVMWSKEEKPQ